MAEVTIKFVDKTTDAGEDVADVHFFFDPPFPKEMDQLTKAQRAALPYLTHVLAEGDTMTKTFADGTTETKQL